VDPSDSDLEAILRDARPRPEREFVRGLEASLFAKPAPRRRPVARSLVACAGLAGVLAATVLGLMVAGVSPLNRPGDEPARAVDRCRTLVVMRHEYRNALIVTRSGEFRIVRRMTEVPRTVRRCD
jgi:hypothetical protein